MSSLYETYEIPANSAPFNYKVQDPSDLQEYAFGEVTWNEFVEKVREEREKKNKPKMQYLEMWLAAMFLQKHRVPTKQKRSFLGATAVMQGGLSRVKMMAMGEIAPQDQINQNELDCASCVYNSQSINYEEAKKKQQAQRYDDLIRGNSVLKGFLGGKCGICGCPLAKKTQASAALLASGTSDKDLKALGENPVGKKGKDAEPCMVIKNILSLPKGHPQRVRYERLME